MMKIMLADDQIPLYSALQSSFEYVPGFEVIDGGTDVTTLLQKLAETESDILLLDWDLNGIESEHARGELIRTIQTLYPAMRIAVMSSALGKPDLLPNMHVDGYISKTESPELLLDLLITLQSTA